MTSSDLSYMDHIEVLKQLLRDNVLPIVIFEVV